MRALLSFLSIALYIVLSTSSPAAEQDLATQITALENDVSITSADVCGKEEPTDPDQKALFDAKKKVLEQSAKNLIILLDKKKTAIDTLPSPVTAADKATMKSSVDDEEKALKETCPSLPAKLKSETGAQPQQDHTQAQSGKPILSISPNQLNFDHQTVQTKSAPQNVTVTNTSNQNVQFAVRLEPKDIGDSTGVSNFQIAENGCSNTLAPSASCTIKIAYVPFEWSQQQQQSYIALVPLGQEKEFDHLATALAGIKGQTKPLAIAESRAQSTLESLRSTSGKDNSQKTERLQRAETDLSTKTANRRANEGAEQAHFQALQESFNLITMSGTPDHWKYPLTRAVAGLDVSAPSSRTVKQAYFIDFDLLAPLPVFKRNNDPLENRLWVWLNPRITSLPQATNFSALSTINETGSFFDQLQNQGKVNEIAQGLDVNGGIEIALVKPRKGIPWWAEYTNTEAKLGVSFIAGLGLSTPFNTDNTDVLSQVNKSICDAFMTTTPGATRTDSNGLACTFPVSNGTTSTTPVVVAPDGTQKTFIDFVTPDRSRFFRRYYVGLRLKTFFFSKNIKAECSPQLKDVSCDAPYDIFPGIVDFSTGKDDAVTGGHMSTWLFRVEAVYPLPFYQGIHVFGSVYTAMSRHSAKPIPGDQPFNNYTIQAPTAGTNNDLNTFRFNLRPLSRDYFRIGIGIDLIQVFKKASNGGQPAKDAPVPEPQKNIASPAGSNPKAVDKPKSTTPDTQK